MDFRISLAGLLVGFLVGITGMGGGSLLAPIMILFFKVPPTWVIGTDIAYSTVTKALGSVLHIRQKNVNFKVALWLAYGSIPAMFLSVFFLQYLRQNYQAFLNGFLLHAIGLTLLLVAVLLVIKPALMRRLEQRKLARQKQAALAGRELADTNERWERVYRPMVTVIVGAVIGFLVGLTSVGSGTLIIVSIAFLFPALSPKELVGTDIFQAFLLLCAGVIGYLSAGTINWNMVGLLLLGSLPGVFIGSKASKYLPDRYLRPALAVVLAISGYQLSGMQQLLTHIL